MELIKIKSETHLDNELMTTCSGVVVPVFNARSTRQHIASILKRVATEGHPYKNDYRIIVLRASVGVALRGHPF